MTSENDTQLFSNWAKERLAEIEATLAALQASVNSLQDEARRQAEKTIADIRAQQQAFQHTIKEQQENSQASWQNLMRGLEANWTSFEALMQTYAGAARKDAAHLQQTFAARAQAQIKAWYETLDALRGKASAFAEGSHKEAEDALHQLKSAADSAKAKLESQQKAGVESWDALKTALEESRAAFDKATRKAIDSFKKTA